MWAIALVGGIVLLVVVREGKSKQTNKQIDILKEDTMKSSKRDKTEGKFHQMKGKLKEVAGDLTDNPKLEAEGMGEKIVGKAQENIGKVKKVWGK
ncbi:MAG: CsbD family protein [Smithella sp.]